MSRGKLLWIFADGVGLAAASQDNPFASSPPDGLARRLGGRLVAEMVGETAEGVLVPLDATLGVDGLPQSATGQTALFTGVNAPAELGRHVTALPGPRLRAIVEERSVLAAAIGLGASATFANAYSEVYLRELGTGRRRASVTTCTVRAARMPFRTLRHLARDEAVTWDSAATGSASAVASV